MNTLGFVASKRPGWKNQVQAKKCARKSLLTGGHYAGHERGSIAEKASL